MTEPQRTAELIPFDSVHRLVQERRQRRAAQADPDAGSLTAARTSQVRRLLAEQRDRTSGPEVA
jgi:hypothetical protein